MDRVEIAVVGSGLVGSLLAMFLRRRGHEVVVYERRPDMRRADIPAGRSINLISTSRSLNALAKLDLADKVRAHGAPVRGRMMHAVDGTLSYHPYGKDDSEVNYSVSRGELNELLMTEAEERGVRIFFEHKLMAASLPEGRLRFYDEARGCEVEVQAERIFGTDGAGSVIRDAMAQSPGHGTTFDDLGHGYKELHIPAAPDGTFVIDGHSLHIWPRGREMLMALPNHNGTFTVTLYLPQHGESGFLELDSPEKVLGFFERLFPDSIPLISDLTDDFIANPTGTLGTRRCARWDFGDRAVMLGDAAHAIVPFFGQGMNCGFEDVSELDRILDETAGPDGEDWGAAFHAFSQARKPHADAIADMSLENFHEMCSHVGDPDFLLRKGVEHRLENELPGEYRSRYSMVVYSLIPYRVAFEAGKIQSRLLDSLCASIDTPEQLDLASAREAVRSELTPFLDEHGVRLDY
ncbi:MAG: NAD(P)/FAD-dependent oxidoreductase [Planctomycetota bacterium]